MLWVASLGSQLLLDRFSHFLLIYCKFENQVFLVSVC